jgi:outer membrane lipoprotein-sorting protein
MLSRRSLIRWVPLALLVPPLAARAAPEPHTVDEVLRRAEEQFRSLTDYECLAENEARQGDRTEAGAQRFWFKKPSMLRARVIRGPHKGSEVAVDASGEIRGHQGGLLRGIIIHLNANDSRIRSIRGVPVTELDWGAFYRKFRERAARPGAHTLLSPHPQPDAPYELVVRYHTEGKAMREIYRIDPRLWVMTEGQVFEDETRVEHIVFSDIKLNTGVSDGWFKL